MCPIPADAAANPCGESEPIYAVANADQSVTALTVHTNTDKVIRRSQPFRYAGFFTTAAVPATSEHIYVHQSDTYGLKRPTFTAVSLNDDSVSTLRPALILTRPPVVSADGSRAYLRGLDDVRVFTFADGTTKTVLTLKSISTMAVSPDGTRLYVTTSTSKLVQYLSADGAHVTDVVTGGVPSSPVVSPDGAFVYVAIGGRSPKIAKYDAKDLRLVAELTVDSFSDNLVPSPDGSRLFYRDAKSIAVVDTTTMSAATRFGLIGSFVLSPNGGCLYAIKPVHEGGGVFRMSSTGEGLRQVDLGPGVRTIAFRWAKAKEGP
ncbi:hypothetical protein GCM10022267_83670 [Lentzea roselyniae]|uniref:YncE family protein n=1 Tax=Lentzea roselyniae TaxID=531940 RepID=A0ABP7CBV2_9PSEU